LALSPDYADWRFVRVLAHLQIRGHGAAGSTGADPDWHCPDRGGREVPPALRLVRFTPQAAN